MSFRNVGVHTPLKQSTRCAHACMDRILKRMHAYGQVINAT